MFVAARELKKLMKEAYKGSNLIVGCRDGMYYLQGTYWKQLCKKAFVPKEILGAIIELTGEIPGDEECFCAGPDGNQVQINPMEIDVTGLREEVAVTEYVLLSKRGVPQRMLQSTEGEVYLINNKFVQMISMKHCDYENGETEPEEPVVNNKCTAYWKNNVMEFTAVLRQDERHGHILDQMRMIDLMEV